MAKLFVTLGASLITLGLVNAAQAADCALHVKRIACAGQETQSFAKCAGKAECDEMKDAAATQDACMKEAAAACANGRIDVTKYKSITGSFKGQSLVGGFGPDGAADPKGANFCAADRADMNKCK